MADGYDPNKSRVSDEKMETWRTTEISGDLTQVPGIGDSAIKKLKDDEDEDKRITNTYQLFGKYLMLRGPDDDHVVSVAEANQKMWYWLKLKGISSHRSAIVKALNLKTNTFFSGYYDIEEDEAEE